MNCRTMITRLITTMALMTGLMAVPAPSHAASTRSGPELELAAPAKGLFTHSLGIMEYSGRAFMLGVKSVVFGSRPNLYGISSGIADASGAGRPSGKWMSADASNDGIDTAYRPGKLAKGVTYDFKYMNAKDKSSGTEPFDILTLHPNSTSDKHLIMAEFKFTI